MNIHRKIRSTTMATYFQSSFTCRDKKALDINKTSPKISYLLSTNRGYTCRKVCILCSQMLRDVGDPLQGRYHRRRQNRSRRALDGTALSGRGVPVQADHGASLWEQGVTERWRGRRGEGGSPRTAGDLHPQPCQVICGQVTVKITVVYFISGVEGVQLVAAILVTVKIDVRLLGDPGGRAMGRDRSKDREEFIDKAAPPEKAK